MTAFPTATAACAIALSVALSAPAWAQTPLNAWEDTAAAVSDVPTGAVEIARAVVGKPVRTRRGVTVGLVTDVEMRRTDEPQIASLLVQPLSPTGELIEGAPARLAWGDVVYQPRGDVVEIAMTAQEFLAQAGLPVAGN